MLWRYCESSAHYIFGDREVRNPLAKKILRLITGRSLALTDIHRELGRNIESKAVRATLKALEEGKKIIRTTSNPLGRTKSVYTAV
jgi:DNA-binding HxlR family transcriptional regulator